MAGRRPGLRRGLGVQPGRAGVRPGAVVDLAGGPGPDGPRLARRLAGRPAAQRADPPAARGRAPDPARRHLRRDPRRAAGPRSSPKRLTYPAGPPGAAPPPADMCVDTHITGRAGLAGLARVAGVAGLAR